MIYFYITIYKVFWQANSQTPLYFLPSDSNLNSLGSQLTKERNYVIITINNSFLSYYFNCNLFELLRISIWNLK